MTLYRFMIWAMRKESVTQYLLRRLDASAGMHSRIAKECGIGQATMSRIYLRKASPRLDTVDSILAWFDRRDREEERKKLPPRSYRKSASANAQSDQAPASQ